MTSQAAEGTVGRFQNESVMANPINMTSSLFALIAGSLLARFDPGRRQSPGPPSHNPKVRS